MAYIPPNRRQNASSSNSSSSYGVSVNGEPAREYGRGQGPSSYSSSRPSSSQSSSYGESRQYGRGQGLGEGRSSYEPPKSRGAGAYVPPAARGACAPSYEKKAAPGPRRLTVGKTTLHIEAFIASDWRLFEKGDLDLTGHVTEKELKAWYGLVNEGTVTLYNEVSTIIDLLHPVELTWTLRLLLPGYNEVWKGSMDRETLLAIIGEEVRQHPKLVAENFYTPVEYVVHGNFAIWKDPVFNNKGVEGKTTYTQAAPDTKAVIEATPSLNVLTGVLQQAWLRVGEEPRTRELPLSAIEWADLRNVSDLVSFLRHVPPESMRPRVLENLSAKSDEELRKRGIAVIVPREKRLTFAQQALINEALPKTLWVKSAVGVKIPKSILSYRGGTGTLWDRLYMATDLHDASVGRPDRTQLHIADWDTRMESEEEAMALFNAVLHAYLLSAEKKKDKIRLLSLNNLVDERLVAVPQLEFIWVIVKELLYQGDYAYSYTDLDLVIPTSAFEAIAQHFSEHLNPTTFEAFRDFIKTADSGKRMQAFYTALSKHKGTRKHHRLPVLHAATEEVIAQHNTAAKAAKKQGKASGIERTQKNTATISGAWGDIKGC